MNLSKRSLFLLALIILLRIIFTFITYSIVTTFVTENPYVYQGGDQIYYFALALSLSELKPIKTFYFLGYPLLLVPLILVTSANDYTEIFWLTASLNIFVYIPLIQFFLFDITRTLFGKKNGEEKGVYANIFFAVFPWFFAAIDQTIPMLSLLLGFNMSSDLASLLFFMIAYRTILYLRDHWSDFTDQPDITAHGEQMSAYSDITSKNFYPYLLFFFTGLLIGFNALIRAITIFVGLPLYIFLLEKIIRHRNKNRTLLYFLTLSIGIFLGFLPQLIYNTLFWGSPLTFGYFKSGGYFTLDQLTVTANIVMLLYSYLWTIPFILPALLKWRKRYPLLSFPTVFIFSPLLTILILNFFWWAAQWAALRFTLPILPLILIFLTVSFKSFKIKDLPLIVRKHLNQASVISFFITIVFILLLLLFIKFYTAGASPANPFIKYNLLIGRKLVYIVLVSLIAVFTTFYFLLTKYF